MKFHHLNINIDKEKYRNHFWSIYQTGEWHECTPPSLFWWKVYKISNFTKELETELNIKGLNNFPRYSYQIPNTLLEYHVDEDDITSINLNLLDNSPTIHINYKPYIYETCLFHAGGTPHGVEPDPFPRLILKFAIRHPWDEVYERLDKFNLILQSRMAY